MTTPTLADRIEAAERGDRELDRAIAVTQGWRRVAPRFTRSKHGAWISPEDWIGEYASGQPILDGMHGTTMHREVPAYTTSLDAAMTLVCAERFRRLEYDGGTWWATLTGQKPCEAATPALALCAASLRAKEQSHAD
jgi:hypothetical protein